MFAMKNKTMVLFGLLGALAAGCGRGSSSASSKNSGESGSRDSARDASARSSDPGITLGKTDAGLGAGAQPPEQETKVDYLAPRAGDRRVYVANPTRNTVTIIDSTTLAISEQATGDTPIVVATVPGKDVALVINAGSHTLRVLRDTATCAKSFPIVAKANAVAIAPDGLHAVVWFDSAQSIPGITSSSSGSTQEVSVVGLGTGCDADKVASVSVGYNPTTVVFSSDSTAAFVVTDDGISELRFANINGPSIAPFTRIDSGSLTLLTPDAGAALGQDGGAQPGPQTHGLPADGGEQGDADDVTPEADALPPVIDALSRPDFGTRPPDASGLLKDGAVPEDTGKADTGTSPPDARPDADRTDSAPVVVKGKAVDVSVTKTGEYAIARREGSGAILLIDLKAKTVLTALLSSEITDLDLVDAPTGAQAFAVLRSESKLVRLDIPAGFSDPARRKEWSFSGATIGSVTISPKSTYALLYTTATASKDLAVFDLVREQVLTPPPDIHKNIRAVAIAPDEKTALVLHTRTAPSSSSKEPSQQDIVDQSYGYTMVDLTTGFSKLQLTQADPAPFTITPDSSHAFVLLRDDKTSIRVAQRISLTSFLATDFPLGSPPNSIAALSPTTHKVFVGQVYSEGRISFIDWVSGSVESVTGFALNGRIKQ
jgi:hypothetical protein